MTIKDFLSVNNSLFWDVDINTLTFPLHDDFVIERILEKGDLESVKSLIDIFGIKKIKNTVKNTSNISNKTALFWSKILNLEKDEIKCLKIQSRIRQLNF